MKVCGSHTHYTFSASFSLYCFNYTRDIFGVYFILSVRAKKKLYVYHTHLTCPLLILSGEFRRSARQRLRGSLHSLPVTGGFVLNSNPALCQDTTLFHPQWKYTEEKDWTVWRPNRFYANTECIDSASENGFWIGYIAGACRCYQSINLFSHNGDTVNVHTTDYSVTQLHADL